MKTKVKKKSNIRNVVTIISDVFFIFVLLLLIELCMTVSRGEVPGAFGYKALRVVSSSMEPLLCNGDCILVKEIEPCEVKEGDVISFFSSDPILNKYINTHRVVGVELDDNGNYLFITKGDNNKYEDYYLATGENLLGIYFMHLPFENAINLLFKLLSNRVNFFIFMILPILFCLIESVVSIINAILSIVSEQKEKTKE